MPTATTGRCLVVTVALQRERTTAAAVEFAPHTPNVLVSRKWSLPVTKKGGKGTKTVKLKTHWLLHLVGAAKEGKKEKVALPTKLPPLRSQDHIIPLMHGTQPVNTRPYRHPHVQKDAIEAMVKELLDSGVIKHNQSSFA
ncbi:hypothetical protein Tco_1508162, partial [Tanacetum coccineum]